MYVSNTDSSMFRFVLASLLLDPLNLTPMTRGDKTILSHDEDRRLTDWQRKNLRLTWCGRERPREVEDEVIALMLPPL